MFRNDGTHCPDFCSELLVVIATYVGPNWALTRLRRHMLGICYEVGKGRSTVAAGGQGQIALTLGAAGVVGEGALRGRSPRTREGRIGPTAQLPWSVISGQWSVKAASVGNFVQVKLLAGTVDAAEIAGEICEDH